jgi:hypothetical protein
MIWHSKHQVFNQIEKNYMFWNILVSQFGWSSFWLMQSAEISSAEPSSAKLDGSVKETRGSRIFRSLDELSETTTAKPDDWRTPLVHYLENPV